MWDAKPYMQRHDGRPTCFERVRDRSHVTQAPSDFANATKHGQYCVTNWYEGNQGVLGLRASLPTFTNDAPVSCDLRRV